MAKPPEITPMLMQMLDDARADTRSANKAHIVLALTPITMLIDAEIITVEEAVQRIELIHGVWQKREDDPQTKALVETAILFLRKNGPKSHSQPQGDAPRWTPEVIDGGVQDPPQDS